MQSICQLSESGGTRLHIMLNVCVCGGGKTPKFMASISYFVLLLFWSILLFGQRQSHHKTIIGSSCQHQWRRWLEAKKCCKQTPWLLSESGVGCFKRVVTQGSVNSPCRVLVLLKKLCSYKKSFNHFNLYPFVTLQHCIMLIEPKALSTLVTTRRYSWKREFLVTSIESMKY